MPFRFPDPLYPVLDADSTDDVVAFAEQVLAAGARVLQLRAKQASTGSLLALARAVQARAARAEALLLINDRADVAAVVGAAGVHLGQDDLPAAAARALLGPRAIIGVSTHTLDQLTAAVHAGEIDYIAFGPIFATTSKRNPDPVQGLAGLGAARRVCPLPLVAIGGIDAATAAAVRGVGADAVAVIGAIASAADPTAATRQLRAILAQAGSDT